MSRVGRVMEVTQGVDMARARSFRPWRIVVLLVLMAGCHGDSVVLHPAPVSLFEASPSEGNAPLRVQFTDLSTGEITAWRWDLGDGAFSEERHPAHLYADVGSYSVSLEVKGAGGINTMRKANCILVGCADDDGDGVTVCDGDCDDGDARVHPGQLEFFATPRGSGGYDFDCDGSTTLQYPVQGSCGPVPECETVVEGWTCDSIPSCGEECWWFNGCALEPMGEPHCSEGAPTESRIQACR